MPTADNEYELVITATDTAGLAANQAVTVLVTDVNENEFRSCGMPLHETLGKRFSEVVRYEEPVAMYSREQATTNGAVSLGQLLTLDYATGVCVVTAAGGAANAVAIDDCTAGGKVAVLARHAIVNANGVTYPAGTTPEQKQAMHDSLRAVGILVRA